LNSIENYLGLPPAYHGSHFRRDLANEVQLKSRKWHIDREDRQVVKIIVYLNDVSEDGGPFQYIPKSLTAIAVRSLAYKYGYVHDKPVEMVIPPSEWKSCTGTAGTVIFADTGSIFHRGKKPVESDRFAIFFDYTSRQPKHPYYCNSPLLREDLLILAKTLSERQRKCLFWLQDSGI
ncbi:MAG: 2OG-Fe(II) oxygenase, partial [Coleofasciculus sp. S288]|nr:2OG-Fe(II) oxygenase [Coleofasciculus sp. S288]